MSWQHRKLAEIWASLEGRHDIASILREIIGQHSIETALHEDESSHPDSLVHSVIWIKAIYDLQRCYLSGLSNGVAECPPYILHYLLPPELLLSSILYLVNVKRRLFSSEITVLTKEFTRPRSLLAQCILSGLRLILLRKDVFALCDKRRLQRAVNVAWQHDRLYGVERFIVSDLFAQALDAVSTEITGTTRDSRENSYMTEWQSARLPKFAAGLVRSYISYT